MRKVAFGAVPVRGNWNPKFKVRRKKRVDGKETGRKKTPIVSYHPTIKGEQRSEGPRQYFHRDMALLLDAWPEVVGWTTDAPTIVVPGDGNNMSFTPNFIIEEAERSYALRLRADGATLGLAREERYRVIRQAYERQGMSLVVMTREEVETHPDLPAARTLFYYRYWEWPDDLPLEVAALAEQRRLRTFGELHQALGGSEHDMARLLSLASHGYVLIDTTAGLGPDTPLVACRTKGWRT
jgi:hypothetical protein